ncbi:SAM-dependent methyltransferase [Winogradskyella aurantia]|uniref:SAM-dependent methyltransferase n=2 Tax=Winogradskyella aurantia TaxID=1915063 RepID=A0A265UXW2_9FLAO|nr:SAM-dependent methyltransferase [Winogradskyella aurantia]
MEQLKIILFALLLAIPSYSCLGQNPTETNRYTYKNGDPNGIGKWYLGREIAYVMGYQGISWLERPEREQEEKVSSLIKNMDIQSNDVIADIGAGSGFHVFKMAPLAHNGKIYAVDIQPQMLEAIRTNPLYNKNNNIETILGTEKSVNLPENSIDKILMVDVYHEFNFPYEMIMSMKKALKIDGKLFLIEYRGEDGSIPIKKIHKMTESQAVKEMKAAGFNLESNKDNLPWQHCMVFIKKE